MQGAQQWVLHSQAEQYAVVISIRYKNPPGWADCTDVSIWVSKHINKILIAPSSRSVGQEHWEEQNAASDRIIRIWQVNTHADL